MAHKKGVGSSRNGRDSHSQRLGLKKFGGERVLGGKANPQAGGERRRSIDVGQRGTLRRQHAGALERRAMLMNPQPAQAERRFGRPGHIVRIVGCAEL